MLLEEIKKIKELHGIVGRDIEISLILNAAKMGKHILIEGPVGVGKTRLAIAAANFLKRGVCRVDGDERFTESKMTGWFDPSSVLQKGYCWESFIAGPLVESMIRGKILFINELNRMPEGTQNVLLPAMDEGKIILPKLGEVNAKKGFSIIATQNPKEYSGTSKLSEALKDRFIWIGLNYHSLEEEVEIVRSESGSNNLDLILLAVQLIRSTRVCEDLRRGASIRAAIDFVQMLQNYEFNMENIKCVAISTLYNRIEINIKSKKTKEEVIKELVLKLIEKEPKNILNGLKPQNNAEIDVYLPSYLDRNDKCVKNYVLQDKIKYEKIVCDGKSKWSFIEDYLLSENSDSIKNTTEMTAFSIIASIASEISEKGRRETKKKSSNVQLTLEDEVDYESTLENFRKGLNLPEIIYINKLPKKLAVALMFDCSNSMSGEKVVMSALAVAALAYKLEKDLCSVICFNDKPFVIKGFDEETDMETLISRIMHVECGGLTDIKSALESGLEQLNSIKYNENEVDKIAILVTDGWNTKGGDPLEVSCEFPKIHVLQTGIGGGLEESIELCKNISKFSYGEYVFINKFEELPFSLINLLRYN